MVLFAFQTVPCWPIVWYKDPATLIAIATFIYVGATVLLWLETRRSVNFTRNTFKNSFTPIVTIAYITDHPALKELAFSILTANFGNVPAVEVELSSEVFADSFALAPQKQQFGTAFIPPHSDITTTFVLLDGDYERARKVKRLDLHFSVLYEGVDDEKYQYDLYGMYDPGKDPKFVQTKTKATPLGKEKHRSRNKRNH